MAKLVSVLVLSYNSSEYIVQTLESIKNQTYQNIELIISDDCSSDETISLAKRWLEFNAYRFVRTIININPSNRGTVKNFNNGIKFCKGFYIKPISADDILDSMCVEVNYNECYKNNYNVLFSKVKKFEDNKIDSMRDEDYSIMIKCCNQAAPLQMKVLSYANFTSAPTFFVERRLLISLNYFDEKYQLLEDYPMWLKMTENGIKLNFLDAVTVYYRIHANSISNCKNSNIVGNIKYYLDCRSFFFNVRLKRLFQYGYFYKAYKELIQYAYKDLVIRAGNKKTPTTAIVKLVLLLDPGIFISIINNRLFKKIYD